MIEELRKKYPDKKFIEANIPDSCGAVCVKNIDDFMCLDNIFLYCNKIHCSDDETENLVNSILSKACWAIREKLSDEYSAQINKAFHNYRASECDYLYDKYYTDDKEELILVTSDCRVYFREEATDNKTDIKIKKEIDKCTKELMELVNGEIEECKKSKQTILDAIDKRRSDYNSAKTKTEKNDIIKEIKLFILEEYPEYSRDYTKDYIKHLLEKSDED